MIAATIQQASARGESDPLAELARLIGQTDPFGSIGPGQSAGPAARSARDPYQRVRGAVYQRPAEPPISVRPSRMSALPQVRRRGCSAPTGRKLPQQELPPDYPSSVHPLQRYAAARPAPEPEYQDSSRHTRTSRSRARSIAL